MNRDVRKMSVLEIGYGKLGRDLQDEFEQGTIEACELDGPVTLTLKVVIAPPKHENVGKVGYSITRTKPAKKSIGYDAQYDHGLIITTGRPDLTVLQESLKFPETVDFQRKDEVNGD